MRRRIRKIRKHNDSGQEGYLKLIAESVPILISYIDHDHRYLFNNSAYARWFGSEYGDLTGKHLRDLLGNDGYNDLLPYLTRAFKGETVTFEAELTYSNDKTLAIEVTYVPDCHRPGKAEGVVALVNDITDKKRMQRKLSASEARFRIFMENSPAISFIKNRKGRFLFVSKALEKVLGVSPDEWTNNSEPRFLLPDEIKTLRETDEKIIEGHEAVELLEKLTGRKGTREMLVAKFPFEDEEGERLLGGIALDVTERRQAEEALLDSEIKFRTLANSIPQMTWMADSEGRVYWYNQRWYDYTGTTREETLGFGWKNLLRPEDLEHIMKKFQEAIDNGTEYTEPHQLRGKNGEWRWFLSRGIPVRSADGKIVQWVGAATDITESRRLAEEQKEAIESKERARLAAEAANAAKSAFLANMSHEIRTPLGVMIGFSELLKDDCLDSCERHQYLEMIIRNGNELARLIGDILDLSKVEAGHMEMDRVSFSLRTLLDDVADIFVSKAQEKGIAFSISVASSVSATIISDPTRLKQILINIIGNAVKFTSKGGVTTDVRTQSTPEGEKLSFSVTDTGIGVAEEKSQHLFQSFYQGDPSTTRRYGGTGLGLALARRLARALGGDVLLESSIPGKGSTFVVTIDLIRTK